jgi:hypothetical protein
MNEPVPFAYIHVSKLVNSHGAYLHTSSQTYKLQAHKGDTHIVNYF